LCKLAFVPLGNTGTVNLLFLLRIPLPVWLRTTTLTEQGMPQWFPSEFAIFAQNASYAGTISFLPS
jgi:hypothetical protein